MLNRFAPSKWAAMAALAVALLVCASSAANAGIVSFVGEGQIDNPATSKALGNAYNDPDPAKVRGWNEAQDVILDRDVYVDIISSGTYSTNASLGAFQARKVALGTAVNSHLLYFDPQDDTVANVTFTFDGDILGVIVESDRFGGGNDYFVASDFLRNPLTPLANYPVGHFANRGLEMGGPDVVTVSVLGRTVTLDILGASNPGDQIRVLTQSSLPEPTSMVMGLVGLGLSAGYGWRRRTRAAA